MNGLNWYKKEMFECTGTGSLHYKINEWLQTYKTNILLTQLKQDEYNQKNKYVIEAWYNFDARANVIIAYCSEYVD